MVFIMVKCRFLSPEIIFFQFFSKLLTTFFVKSFLRPVIATYGQIYCRDFPSSKIQEKLMRKKCKKPPFSDIFVKFRQYLCQFYQKGPFLKFTKKIEKVNFSTAETMLRATNYENLVHSSRKNVTNLQFLLFWTKNAKIGQFLTKTFKFF